MWKLETVSALSGTSIEKRINRHNDGGFKKYKKYLFEGITSAFSFTVLRIPRFTDGL